MKDDNETTPKYIKSAFTVDYIGTTPSENRVFILGTAVPAALGLTGGGMSLFLHFAPDDRNHLALVPGFLLAAVFGWFIQISMRRAYQMKDRDRRVALIERLRIIPQIAIGLALAGLIVTLVNYYVPPRAASKTFFTLAGAAIVLPVVGVLLLPFSIAARRIGWLVNPR